MRISVFLLFSIGLFFGAPHAVQAEYVLFKVVKSRVSNKVTISSLSQSEFKKAYSVVTQFKWPSNVWTFYQNPQAFPIDYTAPFAEETFIRTKIKKLNSSYDIAFIPDIIYETAFLRKEPPYAPELEYLAGSTHAAILGVAMYKAKVLDEKVAKVIEKNAALGDKQTYLRVLEYMYNLNLKPKTLEIARKINNDIVSSIKKDLDYIQKLTPKNNQPATKKRSVFTKSKSTEDGQNLSEGIRQYFRLFGDAQASWTSQLNKDISLTIIKTVAILEYEAAHKNNALIFRGSGRQDSALRMKPDTYRAFSKPSANHQEQTLLGKARQLDASETIPYSISFGYSLIAGMAIPSGGNVYEFSARSNRGYALKISKKNFFDKTRSYLRDMFFMPPFGTIFSYYGTDDLFHPRTKVGLGSGVEKGQAKINQLFTVNPQISWILGVTPSKKWADMVSDITHYISNPGNTQLFHPSGKKMSGTEILSTFHTELLHLKEHTKKFSPALADIKKRQKPE